MSDISAGESSTQRTDLTGDALMQAIKKQVEFYFSPTNLSMDKFLVSQMDPQMFVPLQIIANFKKVQVLTRVRQLLSARASLSLHIAHAFRRTLRKSLRLSTAAPRSSLTRPAPASAPI
jgi:hypothetical protein